MELLQFVFSSFWVWLGCVVLIVAAGEAVATTAAGVPSEAQSFRVPRRRRDAG